MVRFELGNEKGLGSGHLQLPQGISLGNLEIELAQHMTLLSISGF